MQFKTTITLFVLSVCAVAQQPSASVSGRVTDPSGAAVSSAEALLLEKTTSRELRTRSDANGEFRFPVVPVGAFELRVEKSGFALWRVERLSVSLNEQARVDVKLSVGATATSIDVNSDSVRVATETSEVGKVVTGREVVDLPLNGRDFTQLGLLQPGVAPLTGGLVTAGGSIRAGQAYAVNGLRPEANNYLLDGVRNVNRMDGGYAIRIPIDSIAEFKIISHTAPAEYGSTGGATTSVLLKSGTNEVHGSLWYFGRNDAFDARNFFSREVEPLKQHQYGATLGAPVKRNKLFAFAYWEGFRNIQGITRSATVPTVEQRKGDFSKMGAPLINFLTGQPVPGGQLPPQALSPISQNVLNYFPLPNSGPSAYIGTEKGRNRNDQLGGKLDYAGEKQSAFVRYSYLQSVNENPWSVRGADVPGFPVGDQIRTNSVVASHTYAASPITVNNLRLSYFRNEFLFDKRYNRTPGQTLGFGYGTTFEPALGPPYFITQGYATVGNPITGPRYSTQNTYEAYESLSTVRGRHTLKFGGEARWTKIAAESGIASNGFFVFGGFPFSDTFANFLVGRPVVFFQAGGDLHRGLDSHDVAAFIQDEWRPTRKLTVSAGVRYEVSAPFREIRNRMNAFVPGVQSKIYPQAPLGLLTAGDPGISERLFETFYGGVMPRFGFTYAIGDSNRTVVSGAYGLFFDQFSNGTNQVLTAPISAVPATQAFQLSGPTLNYQDPWRGQNPFQPGAFPRPATALTFDPTARPPYVQDWNLGVSHELGAGLLAEGRYIGTKGTRVPRYMEGNPAIYGPGATAQNADQRRIYAGCTAPGAPCALATAGVISYGTNSTYHAAQLNLSRRFRGGLYFQGSYWWSKTLDYVSSMSVAGSAPRLLSGENDLAQNPFNLGAEHGPSLFDARHRFTFSGAWTLPSPKSARGAAKALLAGWQLNSIIFLSAGTPFTVYDGANVAMQGSAPPISGFSSGRPDAVLNAPEGPRTPDQWMLRSQFRRLNPQTEAGKFGNLGRNTMTGPGRQTVDLSVIKDIRVTESQNVQLRFEGFNVFNRANFLLPVNDLTSPNFGRILDASSPRVLQFALKYRF